MKDQLKQIITAVSQNKLADAQTMFESVMDRKIGSKIKEKQKEVAEEMFHGDETSS